MKKGFTLIELLGVIVLIGLISLLIVPKINDTLKTSKEDLYKIQVENIKDEAKNWVTDHPYDLPKNNGDELVISLGELKVGAYIDLKLINPETDKMFDVASKIKITNINGHYDYSVEIGDNEEDVIKNIVYPKIEMQASYLTYLKVGDEYSESGISVDGNILTSDNDMYNVNITNEMGSLNGVASTPGNYLVTYEIINKQTGVKTVIYRTIIVQN